MMAYFFRVDPVGSASLLARARATSRGSCTAHLSPNEDLLMSPGLERQALDDLASADVMVRGAALTMLERGGSETARPPLLDAFLRLEQAGVAPADANKQGSEQGFVSALVRGAGWILTPEQLRGVLAACSSDQCRRTVTAAQNSFEPPILVSPAMGGGPLDFGDYSVGSVPVHGHKQLQDRIVQFPKGTPFFIGRGVAGSWYGDLRISEIRDVLDATGMKLVDPPPPTPAARLTPGNEIDPRAALSAHRSTAWSLKTGVTGEVDSGLDRPAALSRTRYINRRTSTPLRASPA
jgi:hypothetical protein